MDMKKIILLILIINITIIFFAANVEQTTKQIQILEKWIAYDKNDYESRVKLAKIYEEIGDTDSLERAKELYEEAFKTKDEPYFHLKYGSILIKISNNQWFPPSKLWYVISGFNEMRDAIEDEDTLEFRYIRAESCSTSSNSICLDTAVEDYNYIIINYNNDAGLEKIQIIKYKLARIYEKQKKYDRAIKIYENLIKDEITPEMKTEIIDRLDILQRVR